MEQTPKFTHDQGGSATWHFRPTESGPAQTLSTKELRAHSEGPRANSTRFTVYLKYFGFFMVTVLAAVITNGFLVTAGTCASVSLEDALLVTSSNCGPADSRSGVGHHAFRFSLRSRSLGGESLRR